MAMTALGTETSIEKFKKPNANQGIVILPREGATPPPFLPPLTTDFTAVVDGINQVDTFMLTMAMTALGTETSIEKFKKAGAKPFVLATILYVWLLAGGYLLAKYVPQLA